MNHYPDALVVMRKQSIDVSDIQPTNQYNDTIYTKITRVRRLFATLMVECTGENPIRFCFDSLSLDGDSK